MHTLGSLAYPNTGLKLWCATASILSSRILKRCYSGSGLRLKRKRAAGKRGSVSQVYIQLPGVLLYAPHLRPHAVLTLDTGKLLILSGWDAASFGNRSNIVRVLDTYTFGERRETWRKILGTESREELMKWVLAPVEGPQGTNENLQKHRAYWEEHCPHLLKKLTIDEPGPSLS